MSGQSQNLNQWLSVWGAGAFQAFTHRACFHTNAQTFFALFTI